MNFYLLCHFRQSKSSVMVTFESPLTMLRMSISHFYQFAVILSFFVVQVIGGHRSRSCLKPTPLCPKYSYSIYANLVNYINFGHRKSKGQITFKSPHDFAHFITSFWRIFIKWSYSVVQFIGDHRTRSRSKVCSICHNVHISVKYIIFDIQVSEVEGQVRIIVNPWNHFCFYIIIMHL